MYRARPLMPNARKVLGLFSRDELLALIDQHNLKVADRRQRAQDNGYKISAFHMVQDGSLAD